MQSNFTIKRVGSLRKTASCKLWEPSDRVTVSRENEPTKYTAKIASPKGKVTRKEADVVVKSQQQSDLRSASMKALYII